MESYTVLRSAFAAVLCLLLVHGYSVESAETSSTEPNLPQSSVQSHYNITSQEECNCVCGVSRSTRIVGGSRAGKAEFPWLAAMYLRNKYYCGGTLITEKHVLTAAHCFHRIRYSEVTLTLGSYDINDATEKPLKRSILRVTTHPDFLISTFDSDVAIVELDKPVAFGAWNIGTACLPEETLVDYEDVNGTVVGRGRTKENGMVSSIPMKVSVPLMTMEKCRSSGYAKHRITDNMLCAGLPTGQKDACQGDSGGPLHLTLSNNSSMSTSEIIGIVSWGRGCARPNFPGVYTRVQKFLPWIRSKIKGSCECTRQ